MQDVSYFVPRVSDIERAYVSPWNKHFIPHDSNGFEPGDLVNFEIVREFILRRSNQGTLLEDRVHDIWRVYFLYSTGMSLTSIRLCIDTPAARGRVFEKGDELLVELAHEIQAQPPRRVKRHANFAKHALDVPGASMHLQWQGRMLQGSQNGARVTVTANSDAEISVRLRKLLASPRQRDLQRRQDLPCPARAYLWLLT